MALRYYQKDCVSEINTYMKLPKSKAKPSLIVIPTAGGKSHIIAEAVNASNRGKIILSPSKEILAQNYEKFISAGGKATIYSASFNRRELSDVIYATLGSVKSMGSHLKSIGIKDVIIDEAHLNTNPSEGMFKTFLDELQPSHILGFTASPFRTKRYRDLNTGRSVSQMTVMTKTSPKFFNNFLFVTQIQEMVQNNYWSPIKYHDKTTNLKGLILNSTGADYTEESLLNVNKREHVNNHIYLLIKKQLKDHKSILVFLDSVQNCYIMKNALGDSCEVVEANTKDKLRDDIIKRFKSGFLRVLVCVGTLTTGFDFPGLESVILGRPIGNLSDYYQIVGRLVRIEDNKTHGDFFDYGGNIRRYGRIEDLVFEDIEGYGYGMYSQVSKKMLTGTPSLGETVTVSDMQTLKKYKFKFSVKKFFEFGNYKGKFPDEIPSDYLLWAVQNATRNMSEVLFKDCMNILKIRKAL